MSKTQSNVPSFGLLKSSHTESLESKGMRTGVDFMGMYMRIREEGRERSRSTSYLLFYGSKITFLFFLNLKRNASGKYVRLSNCVFFFMKISTFLLINT